MLGVTGDEELHVADFGVLVVLHLVHLLHHAEKATVGVVSTVAQH
jgi:hypothetical protein